ncbi:membrane protein [Lancefieldella parvula DNF00906]|uniref:sulfatase-like hydrolase/transferase n=1 Tax=Lancefieldella parvula TaxID=1382 RepID=UPI00050DBD6D|nr:sulfatase-like hydrolase/transferase [Lancefieldella parvula]KGF13620.1 membrane protein [Lancefieldella parvula DNF00906]
MTTSSANKMLLVIHGILFTLALTFVWWALLPATAQAYVDPSVMTYTIQALAAVVVALSAVLGVAFRRSRKVLFRILKIDENANKIVEGKVHRVDTKGAEAANAQMKEILAAEAIRLKEQKEGTLKPKGRIGVAFLVSFFTVFTILVVAPLELVASSARDLSFNLNDVAGPVIIAGLVITLVLTVILSLLRKRVFNVATALVGAIGVASYVQAVFLNGGMPLADGHEVIWSNFTSQMIVSGLIWLVIIAAAVVFSLLKARQLRTGLLVTATALIIVQAVGVASLWGPSIAASIDAHAEHQQVIATREGLYNVSSKKNVVVFVLDTTDTAFVQKLYDEYPETFAPLTGFTWYRNSVGSMIPTRYGIPSLVFENRIRPEQSASDFIQNWSNNSHYLNNVNQLGYSVGLYTDNFNWAYTDYMYNRTINYHEPRGRGVENQLDVLGALRILYKTAFCRDMPWVFKPRFWYYTEDLNMRMRKPVNMDEVDLSSQPYTEDDLKYYQELQHYGLSIDDSAGQNGSFRFIHLIGSHPPYTLDRNVEPTSDPSKENVEEQTMGAYRIVAQYIAELKRLGVYENTSFIITADHGEWYLTDTDIQRPSAPVIMYKPAGQTAEEAAQPMQVSDAPVWHYDIFAQTLKDMGADQQMLSNYTTPLDESYEGEDRPRYYLETISENNHDAELREFVINGDATNFNNWSLTGNTWRLMPKK